MTYQEFLSSIDNSQAATDEYGNLAWHVDCSVMANVSDLEDDVEKLANAKMILDDWQSFFPQLRLPACPACETGAPLTRDACHHPGFSGRRWYACRRASARAPTSAA